MPQNFVIFVPQANVLEPGHQIPLLPTTLKIRGL